MKQALAFTVSALFSPPKAGDTAGHYIDDSTLQTAVKTKFHGVRYGDWKFMFARQDKWFMSPQQSLSSPISTNLKLDPFERMQEARGYGEWMEQRLYMAGPAAKQLSQRGRLSGLCAHRISEKRY